MTGLATFTGFATIVFPGSGFFYPEGPYSGPNGFSFTPPRGSNSELLIGPNNVSLAENPAITSAVDASFANARFVNGSATFLGSEEAASTNVETYSNSFVYEYVVRNGATFYGTILLPNPAGGGLAGRNDYFENGSALPRDRAYFYYSGVSDFAALGRDFSINRYTLGGEKTICDGRASVEVRLPLAGTADPTQSVGAPVSGLDRFVLGNVGVLGKAALVRTDDFILTAGFGVSVPTARDTRINSLSGTTLLEVNNDTVLLQPVVATAWAPTERLFVQGRGPVRHRCVRQPGVRGRRQRRCDAPGPVHGPGLHLSTRRAGLLGVSGLRPGGAPVGRGLLTELSYIKSMGEGNQVVTDQTTLAPLDGGVG